VQWITVPDRLSIPAWRPAGLFDAVGEEGDGHGIACGMDGIAGCADDRGQDPLAGDVMGKARGKITVEDACRGRPGDLTGPSSLTGAFSAHVFDLVIVLPRLIRASWLIGGIMMHRINRRTRINHHLCRVDVKIPHLRNTGHAGIARERAAALRRRQAPRRPGIPGTMPARGNREVPQVPAESAPQPEEPVRCHIHWLRTWCRCGGGE
jgi:hypothetical protein